ncbi:MAG: helix-turn-helix domain-containing protein [Clostridiales bacterium]|nr:helix-turn-helix domain-containing protein [Clostridiales bacterium]
MKLSEGDIIRDRRLEMGLSQAQVASILGMTLHHYQMFEYGKLSISNSRMRNGLRVCAVLRLDPYQIVFGSKKDNT